MAGAELATEGFREGQVGSSAMPHKMNARSAERICGLRVILDGHVAMVGGLAGHQWNEGDVFDSVVRRVALPDAAFATDGLFNTFIDVLDGFGAYPAVIQRELDRYLPFLVHHQGAHGGGAQRHRRETAHEAIKGHAVAVARECGRRAPNATTCSIAWPPNPPWASSRGQIDAALGEPLSFVGTAQQQVADVITRIEDTLDAHPGAAEYTPELVL